MSSPKISVIVVAYMAQDVISDCIESLLKQTSERLVGYRPGVSIGEGLRRFVEWYTASLRELPYK